jgi:hypothetical protein
MNDNRETDELTGCQNCDCFDNVKFDEIEGKIPDQPWIERYISTPAGDIPVVKTRLLPFDRLGAYKVRWGMGRKKFRVDPGLYAVGNPDSDSPVLVTANFKLTFDKLRSELGGIDGWIMVLDTKGINVWCAAGKGTFGTEEIVRRINEVELNKIVSKKKLILPQLAAPGVSAHKVKEQSGFRIIYGPVKAKHIPAFLKSGNKATPDMREVTFNMWERAILIPNDFVQNLKFLFYAAAAFLLLSGFGPGIYSLQRVLKYGVTSVVLLIITYFVAMIFPQLFLPFIPGRSFSAKGGWIGVITAALATLYLHDKQIISNFGIAAWFFIIPAVTSFIAMNYTGVSTYTSLSGVIKEMKIALPVQLAFAFIGVGLWITGLFV